MKQLARLGIRKICDVCVDRKSDVKLLPKHLDLGSRIDYNKYAREKSLILFHQYILLIEKFNFILYF